MSLTPKLTNDESFASRIMIVAEGNGLDKVSVSCPLRVNFCDQATAGIKRASSSILFMKKDSSDQIEKCDRSIPDDHSALAAHLFHLFINHRTECCISGFLP